MECQYFDPKIHLLLCRSRKVTDWGKEQSFQEPFWRFYWHRSKVVQISYKGKSFELGPGNFALIAPETDFKGYGNTEFDEFYIHFQAGYPYDNCKPGIYIFPVDKGILTKIKVIHERLKSEESKPSRSLSLLIHSICDEILALLPDNALPENPQDIRISKTINYIHEHYSEKISNDLLAGIAAMNKNAFIRLFAQQSGITPQKMLELRRVNQACVLLRFSDFSIDEIAQRCGFPDRFYFSRVFKKLRSRGPAQFRKRL